MNDTIDTVEKLEACVGAAGLPVKMKIIDHLDATGQEWIAASPLAFVALAGEGAPRVTLAGAAPGFATVRQDKRLRIPLDALDAPISAHIGQGAGTLFLIPGVGETLRANGRICGVDDGGFEIEVEECFVHCAKALIRSGFWTPDSTVPAPSDAEAFLNATRFLALATVDRDGHVDISPKGDPAGLLIRTAGGRATLAERPGNRLAFGYRNMIAQPAVSVIALVPGATTAVTLSGRAHLSADPTLRGAFTVDGKTPILATTIEHGPPALQDNAALRHAGLWTGAIAGPLPVDAAATLVAHVKLNKARGMAASAIRMAVSRNAVAGGLSHNYKTDLY